MKRKGFRFPLLTFISVIFVHITIAQSNCPKSGSAKTQKQKQLNIEKNKSVTVSSSKTPEFLPLVSGKVKDALPKTTALQDKFQKAEEIKKFIKQRREQLNNS